MRRSRHRHIGAGEDRSRRSAQPLPAVGSLPESGGAGLRFLGFLAGVIRDWGTTLRLAFLVGVTAGAVGPLLRVVRLEDQWHWVLFGALGVGGVAKFRQWRQSRNGDLE